MKPGINNNKLKIISLDSQRSVNIIIINEYIIKDVDNIRLGKLIQIAHGLPNFHVATPNKMLVTEGSAEDWIRSDRVK